MAALTYPELFGTGSGWQTTGYTLTEPAIVIPASALSASYAGLAAFENPSTESAVACHHRLITIGSVSATQASYDGDLTHKLIIAPPSFDAIVFTAHTVGTSTETERRDTINCAYHSNVDATLDSNAY